MNRREFVAASVAGAAAVGASVGRAGRAVAATGAAGGQEGAAGPQAAAGPLRGRVKHSVCRWCYQAIDLDEFCREVRVMGISSVELVGPESWPVLAMHGLTCAVATGPTKIPRGFNRVENHAGILERLAKMLPEIAALDWPMMIVFSGNNAGISDEEGMKNCVAGLKEAVKLAERHNVTLVMELLNSKVDHLDYMARSTKWGVELVKRVGSERFKLLYDIYHMQIMEGDVIRTIQENIGFIGHFHTAGVPGRREIDESQELNYRAIIKAIMDAGYTGYIGQEFLPSRGDSYKSLREAVQICDV